MKEIINLTPHAVNVVTEKEKVTFEPSGIVARCEQFNKEVGVITTVGGVFAISETTFGEVIDLPEPKENTFYIVSRLIMQACPERNDLLVPNEIVRDENGVIVGCKSLSRN